MRPNFSLTRNSTHLEICQELRQHSSCAHVPFRAGLGFRGRIIEEVPQDFFEEQDLLDDSPRIDLHHLGDEEGLLDGSPVHSFQQPPLQLPEFLAVQFPTLPPEGFADLDEGVQEVMPELLHDVEVVELLMGLRPHPGDDFGEGGQ